MKMQIDGQHLRLRLSEQQLDKLIRERRLVATLNGPQAAVATRAMLLEEGLSVPVCRGDLMNLQVILPLAAFLAFVQERPRRDGFNVTSEDLEVSVEVDVRDSRRRQSAERSSAGGN